MATDWPSEVQARTQHAELAAVLSCVVPGLPPRPAELLTSFHEAAHHLAEAEHPLEAMPNLHQAGSLPPGALTAPASAVCQSSKLLPGVPGLKLACHG